LPYPSAINNEENKCRHPIGHWVVSKGKAHPIPISQLLELNNGSRKKKKKKKKKEKIEDIFRVTWHKGVKLSMIWRGKDSSVI
jgi:hypothetical protein